MMQWAGENSLWFYELLHLLTWVLVIAVLVSLTRWLWKKGDKEK